jgi:hypothetical protein
MVCTITRGRGRSRAYALAARAAAVLAPLGCGPQVAAGPEPRAGLSGQAIVAGVEDDGDTFVVALVDGEVVRCSGVVIARRVLLTSAHCLAGRAGPWVALPAAGGGVPPRVELRDLRLHPDFRPVTLGHDIALALLASAAPADVAPVALHDGPGEPLVGREVRLVGFGRTDVGSPTRRRHAGTARVVAMEPATFQMERAPASGCHGDSGGAVLVGEGGDQRLVGVIRGGDDDCGGVTTAVRLEPYLSGFILPYVEATRPGAAASGQRCFGEDSCREGRCLDPDPAGGFPYCAAACDRDEDCPAGMTCPAADDRRCRHRTPSPGAFGAACGSPIDCVGALCAGPLELPLGLEDADGRPGPARFTKPRPASGRCGVRCFPGFEPACPAGSSCTPASGFEGRHACLPGG